MEIQRLDKWLANSGYGSRKEVRKTVRDGRVTLDGTVITDPGFRIGDNELAAIRLDGNPVVLCDSMLYMLNKPAGLITAMDDPARPTIAELIPEHRRNKGLFPIGRLDKDTTGLLLLTTDGQLGHRVASPKWQVPKVYFVVTDGRVWSDDERAIFAHGIQVDDDWRADPAELTVISPHEILLEVSEGKYHQIKRMVLATGRNVLYLQRISIGNVELDDRLDEGEMRPLTRDEAEGLYALCDLTMPENILLADDLPEYELFADDAED